MNDHHDVLRLRLPHHHNRVTFVELFYDLVFVFAITQLSHTLMHHFTLAEVGEMLLLLLAVWITWIYTAWFTNWLDPDNYLVRIILLVLMLAGLLFSSSIPAAFGERGFTFAAAYVFMQLSRTGFTLWSMRHQPVQYRNFQRIMVWVCLSGIFWLAGGLAQEQTRVILWIIAASLEVISPAVRFWTPFWGSSSVSDWEIDGAHMAERCGLFIIIALGESLLVTGSIFSNLAWNGANVTAFVASFAASALLWWLYFDHSAEAASRVIAESRDPGRLGRSVYTYYHIVLVAGIVLLAVSDEFILTNPTGETDIQTMVALLGGTALYLLGNLLIKWTVWGRIRFTHLIALALLLLLIPAANLLSPLWMTIITTLILLTVAVVESYYYHRYPLQAHVPATAPSE